MDTKKHIVKLTPHDKFFFGGENTFGEKNQANYFVKSNYFPQQTGILGLVRHQLLLQCNDTDIFENNKIKNIGNKTDNLIGKESFRVNNADFNFGAIKSLSPVFICNKSKDTEKEAFYFPANKEYQINEKDNYNLQFLEINLDNIPELLKYDPKYGGIQDLFINKNDEKLEYLFNKNRPKENFIFKEFQQVGIRKEYNGGTNDKSYYLQTFLKFNTNFCFAFIVELDAEANFATQDIVVFGGEQQAFKMEVDDFEAEFKSLLPQYKESANADKIVLVSDAFVEKDIIEKCDFAITEIIDFKFLETNTKEGNYYKAPTKSKKFNLYKKGSVFYGDTAEIEKLFKNKKFEKLGYNHFKLTSKK